MGGAIRTPRSPRRVRSPAVKSHRRHPTLLRTLLAPAGVAVAIAVAVAVAVATPPAGASGEPVRAAASTTTTNPASNAPTDPFYVPPRPLPKGKPGDVIRSQPLAGAPAGSRAWRVLYRSVGIDGKPIAVSGIVVSPTGAVPKGGRPIVSWAHPTTGVVDACAPSTLPDVFGLIPGLDALLAAGDVVAATDYEGLGTPGVHPYLVGASEGRSVLDAARAARHLKRTGAGNKLLLWGHSQGGQASLFAGQMAPTYAPELDLVATAAAAPAGELRKLLDLDSDSVEGIVLGAYAVNAYHDVYGPKHPDLSESQVVTAQGQTIIPPLVKLCDITQAPQMLEIAAPLTGRFFVGDPGAVKPWKQLLAENTTGHTKIASPVFLAQGTADTVVDPPTTVALAATYCREGTRTTLQTYPGVSHDEIGYASASDVVAWMQSVLGGKVPADTCATTNQ